jgi:hypothetical protein
LEFAPQASGFFTPHAGAPHPLKEFIAEIREEFQLARRLQQV